MKTRYVLLILALLALGADAWAGPGGGYAGSGCGSPCFRGNPSMGVGNDGPLSSEEAQKAAHERDAFFSDTEALRNNLNQLQRQLKEEMAKNQPDEKRALALQKDISSQRSELDQRWIQHRMKMKAISPHLARGGGSGAGKMNRKGRCWGSSNQDRPALNGGGPWGHECRRNRGSGGPCR